QHLIVDRVDEINVSLNVDGRIVEAVRSGRARDRALRAGLEGYFRSQTDARDERGVKERVAGAENLNGADAQPRIRRSEVDDHRAGRGACVGLRGAVSAARVGEILAC